MGLTIIKSDVSDDPFEDGIPVYSATQDMSVFGYIKRPNLIIHKGDFVLGARGTLGFPSIIEEEEATCTQTTICICNIHGIHRKYLLYSAYAFHDEWFKPEGTAMPQLTVAHVNENRLPLPPLAEQEAIVSYLDEMTGRISDMENNLSTQRDELLAYRQSVISEYVTGKKRVS